VRASPRQGFHPLRETRENNYFTEMCSGSEEGSYLRLIDFLSLNSRLESNKEEEEGTRSRGSASIGSSGTSPSEKLLGAICKL